MTDRLTTLMRAARAGDAASYRRFLEEAATRLRATARRALIQAGRGDAEVEDVVQEALLAVHLKQETWDSTRPVGPWLASIARHKFLDALRRRGYGAHVDLSEIEAATPSPQADPIADVDAPRLLRRLNERSRRIVTAVAMEGRASADIGRELDMSEGAVRVALHRALKQLASFYKDRGDKDQSDAH